MSVPFTCTRIAQINKNKINKNSTRNKLKICKSKLVIENKFLFNYFIKKAIVTSLDC